MRIIQPQALTARAFAPYGEVLETAGHEAQWINQGSTEKYADLARLVAGDGGRLGLHLFRSQPAAEPIAMRTLERHRLGSQAFIPLHPRPFPVVVAAPDAPRSAESVRVFLSNGRQGINLRPGTWHHALLCLGEPSDFLVLDRLAEAPDCEEWTLDQPLLIRL